MGTLVAGLLLSAAMSIVFPVEITQQGLRQVQVHPRIGFTFAAALRSLRAE